MITTQPAQGDRCSVSRPDCAPAARYTPAVDIVENGREYVVLADVPGAAADGIDVQFDRGALALHARVAPRELGETRWLRQEYGVGDYRRTFRLGDDVDAARIEAALRDGVLTIRLPKLAAATTRRVPVTATT